MLWVYDPCAADVIGRTGEALVLYDCVDDFSSIASYGPGEQALAAACDAHCAAEADVVSVTTSSLYERHRKHSNVHLVRNVGDYAHFETAVDPRNAPADLRSLAHPVLGFAGNIVPGKIDLDLVEHLVDSYPNGSIVLAGPVDPELESRVAQLRSRPNFRSLGLVPYQELPSVVSSFDVGLIPYVANGYTRSCFPLKLYEYLAAGKPVIASGLPELAGMEPDVALAPDPGRVRPGCRARADTPHGRGCRPTTTARRREHLGLAHRNTPAARARSDGAGRCPCERDHGSQPALTATLIASRASRRSACSTSLRATASAPRDPSVQAATTSSSPPPGGTP